MSHTTMTSREFNHDAAAAKRAAKKGPVHITNRGELEAVLLSAEEYKKLNAKTKKITELLAYPAAAEVDFDIERQTDLLRAVIF
ncbi:prevent-host-death protein [Alishewanella sp. WH16-1]|nr:prevent-host-death protein [Alishewanella sp. WH16-1]